MTTVYKSKSNECSETKVCLIRVCMKEVDKEEKLRESGLKTFFCANKLNTV
jgi:hypothetical protein